MALGINHIVNGNFETDLSGWGTDAWWQWVAGEAYHPVSDSFKPLDQLAVGVVNGTEYRIAYDIRVVSGEAKFTYADGVGGTVLRSYAVGTTLEEFTTSDILNGTPMTFARNVAGTEFYVDNVSVREVLPDTKKRNNGLLLIKKLRK